jgi:hypothetical protein
LRSGARKFAARFLDELVQRPRVDVENPRSVLLGKSFYGDQEDAWRGFGVIWPRFRSAAITFVTGSRVSLTESEFQMASTFSVAGSPSIPGA